jgi:hypothetical protein
MTKEALKLALEALEADPAEMVEDENGHMVFRRIQAIITLREALANEALDKMAENARELGLDYEPEQEPVAWRAWVSKFPQGTGSDWVYVTKPIMKDSIYNQPLYTTPPQRTWVGLTDEDKESFWTADQMSQQEWDELFSAIEAKLKDKNESKN